MTFKWWTIALLVLSRYVVGKFSLTVENNSPVVIPCQVAGYPDYPSWSGPPNTLYGARTTYSNQPSPDFNPSLEEDKLSRMSWADNKKDLNYSAVIRSDEGDYSCTVVPGGTASVSLNVRVPPAFPIIHSTATGSQNELTVSGTEGTPLTLTCISVGGYPQQTVNWYRASVSSTPLPADSPIVVSGDLYNVTRSYTFTPTSSDDGVAYICQSSYSEEPQIIRTTEVKLFLKLQPSSTKVTFLGNPTESSSPVNIARCSSSGFRPQTISLRWTLGGRTEEAVSNPTIEENTATSTFSVSDTYSRVVGRADNGKTLSCSINHETLSSPKTASVTLIVQFPPLVTTISENPSIVANGVNKMILTCTTGSSNPASSITWYLDGLQVTSDEPVQQSVGQYGGKMTSQVLVLIPTRDMDDHVIKCRAGNGLSGTSVVEDQVALDLKYSPVVTIVSRLESETQPGLLKCLVSGKPAATIKWYRTDNGQTLLLERTGNNSLDYIIGAVSRDDAGTYKCTANNGIGGDNSRTVQLNVHYKPDVTIIAQNATESSTSKLQCKPRGVPDSYTYISWEQTWLGSRNILRSLPGSANLTLNDLRYEHTGIYTCSVDNGVEFSRNPSAGKGQVFFVVKSRPFISTSQQTIQKAAQMGKVTTLEVEFVSNAPGTNIKVEKRGNDISEESVKFSPQFTTSIKSAYINVVVFNKTVRADGFQAEINITVTNQDDFGVYDIVIENDIGIEKTAVNLVLKNNTIPDHAPVIGSVVGGIIGAVFAVIILVLILRRKYRVNCSFSVLRIKDVDSDHNGHGADSPEYNAAVTYEDVSTTKEAQVYDALNVGNDGHDNSHLYTPLDESNSKTHNYYENFKREDPMYKNTVLKNPVQTVL